jgi:hypothetical protein
MVDKATNLLWIDLDISAAGKKLPSVDSYRAFVLARLNAIWIPQMAPIVTPARIRRQYSIY